MDRPLRIGVIAPPWVPVPPPEYGGTELVVDVLARGLARAGHDVVLWTTGDSTCPVRRRSVLPVAAGTDAGTDVELRHVSQAYASLADCDVIHDHTFLGPLWAAAEPPDAVVAATVHGPFTAAATSMYRAVGGQVAIIAISRHQRGTAPEVPVREVIHHGIDLPASAAVDVDRRGGYLLFLGRMCAEKGVHVAIGIARAAGRRLIIAAKMWEPAEREYFAAEVRPLLGPDVEYIGQVSGRPKAELLAGADALLNPIRWPEPFGLVMVEALAAGTPVVTSTEGAAPEIVDHGVTGYLCASESEMVRCLDHLDDIDRAACRRSARERFSSDRMVADHLRLYRGLLARARPLPAGGTGPEAQRIPVGRG
jgi:glycosyltransferase involved in cell wall biosynthesis